MVSLAKEVVVAHWLAGGELGLLLEAWYLLGGRLLSAVSRCVVIFVKRLRGLSRGLFGQHKEVGFGVPLLVFGLLSLGALLLPSHVVVLTSKVYQFRVQRRRIVIKDLPWFSALIFHLIIYFGTGDDNLVLRLRLPFWVASVRGLSTGHRKVLRGVSLSQCGRDRGRGPGEEAGPR